MKYSDEQIEEAARIAAEHEVAMRVLRQIAERKRRTQEQRLASSAVTFIDALRRDPILKPALRQAVERKP